MTKYLSTTSDGAPWPSAWEPQPPLGPPPVSPSTFQPPESPSTFEPPLGPSASPIVGPPAGPSPAPTFGPPTGPQLGVAGTLAPWLDDQERRLTHPVVVEEQLRRAGWLPIHAATEALRYRGRFNEHPLGYTALLASTGIAGLAAGTVGHVLASGIDHQVNHDVLAFWLTLFVVALPFALWAHIWAVQVDRKDPVAVWSRPRRSLAKVLVWACGVVGVGRLLVYAAQLIGSLVGATWATGDSAAAGALNVAITVTIALPLGFWAHGFLHRFDAEDPTQPGRRHRSARAEHR